MNIVIIGVGEIGLYLATLLSKQRHNVFLIDKNKIKLEELTWQMDVAIQQGSGTDWQLLDQLLEMKPDLFLALTDQDEVNLVACTLAKHLGYPKTIARIKNELFLNHSRLDFAHLFNVDYFISPDLLVAYDIYKYIVSPTTLAFENFADGEVQMRTLRIPSTWDLQHKSLLELQLPKGLIIGLIYRRQPKEEPSIIFPHGSDHLFPGDEVTCIGKRQLMSTIHRFFKVESKKGERVFIVGGTSVSVHLAHILVEHHMHVTLIDKKASRCTDLAKELPNCRIMQQDGTSRDFLLAENLKASDYFIMCTSHDERNVVGALVAKEVGCENVAMILSNRDLLPLVHQLGIVHVLSAKIATANRIMALATSQAISSLVSLYENKAEILEIKVSPHSSIVGLPLADIGPQLPRDFLIVMIQSQGRISIAKGDSVIHPGDTLIVICNPNYFQELKNIF